MLSDPQKRKLYDEYGEEGADRQRQTCRADIYPLVYNVGLVLQCDIGLPPTQPPLLSHEHHRGCRAAALLDMQKQ